MKEKDYIFITILPRNEKRLIQVVINTDNQIVISYTVNLWPWKLPINQDSLPPLSKKTALAKIQET